VERRASRRDDSPLAENTLRDGTALEPRPPRCKDNLDLNISRAFNRLPVSVRYTPLAVKQCAVKIGDQHPSTHD
jgi:hypothetical protein